MIYYVIHALCEWEVAAELFCHGILNPDYSSQLVIEFYLLSSMKVSHSLPLSAARSVSV